MARNSFKRLEEEESRSNPGPPLRIKQNLQSNMNVLKIMGQIMEVYLPKVFEFFVMITGGDTSKMNRVSNEEEEADPRLHIDNQSDPASLDDSAPPSGPSNPNGK